MPRTIHIQDIIDSPVTIMAVSATMEQALEADARFLYENSDSYTTASRFFQQGNILIFKDATDIRLVHKSPDGSVGFLSLDDYVLAQGKAVQLAAFFEKYASP